MLCSRVDVAWLSTTKHKRAMHIPHKRSASNREIKQLSPTKHSYNASNPVDPYAFELRAAKNQWDCWERLFFTFLAIHAHLSTYLLPNWTQRPCDLSDSVFWLPSTSQWPCRKTNQIEWSSGLTPFKSALECQPLLFPLSGEPSDVLAV